MICAYHDTNFYNEVSQNIQFLAVYARRWLDSQRTSFASVFSSHNVGKYMGAVFHALFHKRGTKRADATAQRYFGARSCSNQCRVDIFSADSALS